MFLCSAFVLKGSSSSRIIFTDGHYISVVKLERYSQLLFESELWKRIDIIYRIYFFSSFPGIFMCRRTQKHKIVATEIRSTSQEA